MIQLFFRRILLCRDLEEEHAEVAAQEEDLAVAAASAEALAAVLAAAPEAAVLDRADRTIITIITEDFTEDFWVPVITDTAEAVLEECFPFLWFPFCLFCFRESYCSAP